MQTRIESADAMHRSSLRKFEGLKSAKFKPKKSNRASSNERDDRDVAIHEAAHTILALYFGHKIGATTIVPCGDKAGSSDMKPPEEGDDPITYFALEEEIVICLAGKEAAECFRRVWGQRVKGICFGHEMDLECAREHADTLKTLISAEGVERCLKRLRQVARRAMSYPPLMKAITDLADALLAKRTVSANKAKAIFKEAMGSAVIRMPLTRLAPPSGKPGKLR